jgi:CarD family transcriptional regulator
MFKVGDKVVYPLHGAGEIESIEKHEVLGRIQKYYVLRLLIGGMRVMVPTDLAEKVGLRSVIKWQEVKKVFEVLKSGDKEEEDNFNWKVRYTNNLEKMKSGSIYKVAEVARNLSYRSRTKGLSSGERKLLDSACQMIVSELSFAQRSSVEEVNSKVKEILRGH